MIDFSHFKYSKKYGTKEVFFDFNLSEYTGHSGRSFKGFASLKTFLENNPDRNIYLTTDQETTSNFQEEDEKLIVNLKAYQDFSKTIAQNSKNRFQAFLGQNLKHYCDDERKNFFATSTEIEIVERIKQFTPEQKNVFLKKLKTIEGVELPQGDIENISNEDFLKALSSFLNDPLKQRVITNNFSQIQINILEEYKQFLEKNLDKKETFIQDWIDGKIDNEGKSNNLNEEDIKKIKKSRCLIFGLEFISHKREGEVSSKKFDILTKVSQGKNDYVLIELKSPNSDVFEIKTKPNKNDGESDEYHLSDDIARAIPQILEYRYLLDVASDVEWSKIGLERGKVSKCLIIVGTEKNDTLWARHFLSLKKSLGGTIEILTYTDLLLKLETTIKNLRENL